MKRRSLGLLMTGALVAAASIAASCATGPDPTGSRASGGTAADASSAGGSSAAAGAGTSSGGTSSGGTSGSGSGGTSGGGTSGVVDATPWLDAPDVNFVYEANAPSAFDPDASCAATVVEAVPTPLDLYIMLDQSSSMLENTTSGITKWDAVRQALTGFINSSQSDGIGVGIQYFPLRKPGVPAVCASDADCGSSGPCLLNVCTTSSSQSIQFCTQDVQCRPGRCERLGECQNDTSWLCLPVGGTCDGAGAPGGPCVPWPGQCSLQDSCDANQYSTPAVPIALLPGNGNALLTSLNAQSPFGNTPTGPALQGAINYAKSYAQANPSHTVAVVLATDGLPTECLQINQVANIAATGLNGSPSIKTFVIGVFAATDTNAESNLDTIATRGGTAPAYMVDASGNVAQGFVDALDQIRGKTLGCEFQMPVPEAGIVDPSEVQVRYTPTSGAATVVPNVSGVGACTADQWYYDNNATPTKLILCPSLCTKVKAETDPKVDISLGCLGT